MSPQPAAHNPFGTAIALVVGVARRRRFRVALIGGFALPFHGVQRATGDVDSQDAADIRALVAAKGATLNRALFRDYYALFGRGRELDRLFRKVKKR